MSERTIGPSVETMPGTPLPEHRGRHLVPVPPPAELPDPRHSDEGFLKQAEPVITGVLPFPDLEIVDWSDRKSKTVPAVGKLETSRVTFNDGSIHILRKATPLHLKYGIPEDFTLPLATRVNGVNTEKALESAAGGHVARAIGTNQARGHSLLHDAQTSLMILQEDDSRPGSSHESDRSILTGYSMGAMKALGIMSLASYFGRTIEGAVLLDPCISDELDYGEQNLTQIIPYLGRELIALGKTIALDAREERSLARLRRLISTVGISPQFIASTYDKWKILKTGESGTFPASVPKDVAAAIHFLGNCMFNDYEQYQESFEGHPNVECVYEDGMYHLNGVGLPMTRQIVGRVGILQELASSKAPVEDRISAIKDPLATAA